MATRQYYDRRNKRRKLVISLIIEITGDKKLANSLRDRGNKYLLNRFKDLELVNGVLRVKKAVRSKKKVKKEKIDTPKREEFIKDDEIDDRELIVLGNQIKETKSQKRKRLYKEAREAGYTVEEATKLRDRGQSAFNNIIKFNKVVNNQSRYDNWSTWGKEVAKVDKKLKKAEEEGKSASIIFDLEEKKRSIYPKWITDQIEEINEELGYDLNASYGWSVMYHYYTEGGTIEFWKSFFVADPLNPNIYRAKSTIVVNVKSRNRRLK